MTGSVANDATATEVLERVPVAMNALRAQQRAAKAHLKAVAKAEAKAAAAEVKAQAK